jgi:hypothetical protein
LFLVVGFVMTIFARRFARAGLSFYFSDQDLAGVGPRHDRARIAVVGVTIANAALGLLAMYIGIRLFF